MIAAAAVCLAFAALCVTCAVVDHRRRQQQADLDRHHAEALTLANDRHAKNIAARWVG